MVTNHSDPKISVVICAYTEARWDDLVAGVESLRQQRKKPDEIIVVVDYNPSLLDRAQRELPDVHVLPNTGARGVSGARNTGVALAQGDIIAFIDDDAIADPDWLELHTQAYNDPKVIGVGGTISPLWPTVRPYWFPDEFDWVVGCTYRGVPEEPSPVQRLISCNMSVRREAFEIAGGFRSEIGQVGKNLMRSEDTEFTIRLWQRASDRILLYLPAARVMHRVPDGRASWSYFRARCYSEGFSKARMAGMVGTRDALAAERAYTTQTLPTAVTRGLAETVLHGDVHGIRRSSVIVAGLAITGFGYVVGAITGKIDSHSRLGVKKNILQGEQI
ncbi:MAG: glycosyltransferase family 2 protein [Oscillochloris sp.]|nr:glycosyltransferase family 2 protein [Oscillochloris sp.]